MKYSVQRVSSCATMTAAKWSLVKAGRAAAGRGIGERLLADGTAPSEILYFGTAWIWQAGRVEICCANTAGVVTENQPHAGPGAGHNRPSWKKASFLIRARI